MMKMTFSLLVLCFVGTTILLAQTADEKAVAAAVEKLRKAMIAADKTALANIAADQLSYGHSNGLIEDKAAFIDQFVTGKSVFLTIDLSDQTIRISGDAAIVRHRLTGDTNNNKVPGKVDLVVLTV